MRLEPDQGPSPGFDVILVSCHSCLYSPENMESLHAVRCRWLSMPQVPRYSNTHPNTPQYTSYTPSSAPKGGPTMPMPMPLRWAMDHGRFRVDRST